MSSQPLSSNFATTGDLARRRFALMAAEHVVRMGERIRQARKRAGLTQDELADLIPGKTNGTQVSKWELGKHRPGDDTLAHIAKALGCQVADFYVDTPEPGTPDLLSVLSPDDLARRLTRIDRRLGRIEKHQKDLAELVAELAIALAGPPKRKRASGT